jgi:hypothetical protein
MTHDLDVMRLLADSRPSGLDPESDARARVLAAALARGAHGARTARAQRRLPRRPTLGLGLGAAAAVVTLLAAILQAPARFDALVRPGAPSSHAPAVPAAVSGRDVLLAAARRAEAAPATGRYWHVSTRSGTVLQAPGRGTGAYVVEIRSEGNLWLAAAPADPSWRLGRPLGAIPLTPADEAAWRRAGSPEQVIVTIPGRDRGKDVPFDTRPGATSAKPIKLDSATAVLDLGGRELSASDLRQLPDTVPALRAYLLQIYASSDQAQAAGDVPASRDEWLFLIASELLAAPVTPAVRSAAFSVMADVPGVHALGQVRDLQGRTGTGVGMAQHMGTTGTWERQLVFDPSTGLLLADQEIVVQPGPANPWAPSGTRISYETILAAGWTNDTPPAG